MAIPKTAQKTTAYSTDQAPEKREVRQPRGRKVSDYGRQLAEKQKAKSEYGLREAQFHRYFVQASQSTIATGQALFTSLERRLDNILYRTGMAKTRRMARQLVSHGWVLVNNKRINLPSYMVNEGDTITLKKDDTFEYNKEVIVPNWLSYNQKTHIAKVERMPKDEDIVTDINSQLIIEFYSR